MFKKILGGIATFLVLMIALGAIFGSSPKHHSTTVATHTTASKPKATTQQTTTSTSDDAPALVQGRAVCNAFQDSADTLVADLQTATDDPSASNIAQVQTDLSALAVSYRRMNHAAIGPEFGTQYVDALKADIARDATALPQVDIDNLTNQLKDVKNLCDNYS